MSPRRKKNERRRASCHEVRAPSLGTVQLGAKASASSMVEVKIRQHTGARAGTTREASQMPPAQLRAKTTQPMNGGKHPQRRRWTSSTHQGPATARGMHVAIRWKWQNGDSISRTSHIQVVHASARDSAGSRNARRQQGCL